MFLSWRLLQITSSITSRLIAKPIPPFWEYIQFSWIKLQRRLVDLNPILEIHNPSYIAYVQGYTISVERKNNLHFMSTLIIIGVLDDIFDRLYNSLLNLKYLYIRQWSQCT
jgi:hypothetical protein